VGQLLTRLSIWLGDPDAADRWQARHWDAVPHGGAGEADHVALLAGIRGLRGDTAGAVEGYRDALRRHRDLQLDIDIGLLAIDMAYVLGPTHPLAVEAAATGRAAFTASGARLYLDQLEHALSNGPHRTAAPATRSSREAPVRSS
jgi:hypothetical protein